MFQLDPGRKADLAKIDTDLAKPDLPKRRRAQLAKIRASILRQARNPSLIAGRIRLTKAIIHRDGDTAEHISKGIVKEHGE